MGDSSSINLFHLLFYFPYFQIKYLFLRCSLSNSPDLLLPRTQQPFFSSQNKRGSELDLSDSESSSPDEGLEGSTLRVDAQRHTFSLLVLRDEAMDQLWRRDREAGQ